jgi:hypothetical protein
VAGLTGALRAVLAAGLALATGCGRLGYDPVSGSVRDGGDRTGDGGGMGRDGASADGASGPFGDIAPADELNQPGSSDEDPSLTGDLLEIYFRSTRNGDGDIFRATRAAVDDPFGDPARVDALSSTADDATPEVSLDGLTLYLASNRTSSSLDIWWSTRGARTDPWPAPERVVETVVPGTESGAVRDQAELDAVYARRGILSSNTDLYTARRAATDEPWGGFARIDELATAGTESDGHLGGDGLALLYASDRDGTAGGLDLWSTARPALDQPFAAPAALAEINTADGDEDPWLSPDGRWLYFVRDVAGEKHIFRASR